MSRNLASNECPNCGRIVTTDDIVGGTVTSKIYSTERPVLGVEISCPDRGCARPLFVWIDRSTGMGIDLSWSRSFNDEPFCWECNDAPCCGRWRIVLQAKTAGLTDPDQEPADDSPASSTVTGTRHPA